VKGHIFPPDLRSYAGTVWPSTTKCSKAAPYGARNALSQRGEIPASPNLGGPCIRTVRTYGLTNDQIRHGSTCGKGRVLRSATSPIPEAAARVPKFGGIRTYSTTNTEQTNPRESSARDTKAVECYVWTLIRTAKFVTIVNMWEIPIVIDSVGCVTGTTSDLSAGMLTVVILLVLCIS